MKTTVTAADWPAYMEELVKRGSKMRNTGPHRFEADPKCDLYCAHCGAEISGFNHRGAMTRVRKEQQDRRAVIAALEAWEDACTRAHRPDGRATLLNTALLITAGDTLRDLLLGQLERGTP